MKYIKHKRKKIEKKVNKKENREKYHGKNKINYLI
jgi:hypothetical protein